MTEVVRLVLQVRESDYATLTRRVRGRTLQLLFDGGLRGEQERWARIRRPRLMVRSSLTELVRTWCGADVDVGGGVKRDEAGRGHRSPVDGFATSVT